MMHFKDQMIKKHAQKKKKKKKVRTAQLDSKEIRAGISSRPLWGCVCLQSGETCTHWNYRMQFLNFILFKNKTKKHLLPLPCA